MTYAQAKKALASEEDVIVDAIRLWNGVALYWDGRNFRWDKHSSLWTHQHGHTPHVDLPDGAVPGRIALPYNRVLKAHGIGPTELHELGKKAAHD
jgi:hypothetical protein